MIFKSVDLVKALNACFRSAFGNIFFICLICKESQEKHDFLSLYFKTEQIYCNRESGEIARESEWEALVMDAIAMDIAMMMITMEILGLFMFLIFFLLMVINGLHDSTWFLVSFHSSI